MAAEFFGFVAAILCGALISSLYDVVKVRRRLTKKRKIWTGIEDLLYWGICAIIVFVAVMAINDGLFRAYIFIGMLIGAGAYKRLLSRKVVSFFAMIIGFFVNLTKRGLFFLNKVLKCLYSLFIHKRKKG